MASVIVFAVAATGCMGKGEQVPVALTALPATPGETALSHGLKVAVLPFDDKRLEQDRMGRRTHLWGGETYFVVAGHKPGEAVAKVVASYLSRRGWKASVVQPGAEGDADLTVSGQIQELSANAKSGFAHTEITVKSQIAMQTTNPKTTTTSRMTLNGERSRTVFWFDKDDIQEEVNHNLEESLGRLVADARASELLPAK
jgi:hypothetical protein